MTFEEAVEVILQHEGGYVNDPKDPGGETNFGISKRAYPNVDVKALTKEAAKEIYRRDYWEAGKVSKLPERLRLAFFDTAVNSGVAGATKILQATLKLTQDGVLGPKTLAEAYAKDPAELTAAFLSRRLTVLSVQSTFERFGAGWQLRIFRTALRT
jgi:lysozyme family protein